MLTDPVEYSGRAVAITGAGQGLGLAYARALAGMGADLVLNDLDPVAAQAAVAEAERQGARAVAVAGDASLAQTAEDMVRAAIERFGRIDAAFANAGFLRDRSFAKMTAADMEAIVGVHLLGAFHLCKAAWQPMRDAGYGRIVLTTSTSALFGNFGQANYDAAKLGVVGLMNALKLEGERHGIRVNAIAPLAASRMSAAAFPPEALERMDPRWVVAVAAHLGSAACASSGMILQAGAGRVTRMRIVEDGEVLLPEACLGSPAAASGALAALAAAPLHPGAFHDAPQATLRALRDRDTMDGVPRLRSTDTCGGDP